MIIDSHAHYNISAYRQNFRYLVYGQEGYAVREGDREQLFRDLAQGGVSCWVEPGVSLTSCGEILELASRYPGQVFPAMGVHPTRTFRESWRSRKKLAEYAKMPGVVALGETGLDYHYARKDQHRLKQHFWFLYQLDLAWKRKLPVILHVRDAHKDALRILKRHPACKLGGVVHCFYGSKELAEQYLKLGYHIGIGGSALQREERVKGLQEAIRHIPLERILLETDAPFILPYCKDVIPPKILRRTRNTSLILPAVVDRIAELKGCTPKEVEAATAANAIRVFGLPVEQGL